MSREWNYLPCREEVQNVIRYIEDSLDSQGVMHAIEQDDQNPDAFFVFSKDSQGYENFGIIGWNREQNSVGYAAYDPVRGNHDEREDVSEDDSKCFWSPDSAELMVMFLNGEVRKIVSKERGIEA